MSSLLHLIIFLGALWFMNLSSEWIVSGLVRLSKALGIREFVVGFCVMAVASSLPNLFLGITSAVQGIPQLSLGDIVGNNFVNLTLAVAIAIFFSRKKEIPTGGKMVQTTALFTLITAVLPILLLVDGSLTRIDGVVLILVFFGYVIWLFKHARRFHRVYNHAKKQPASLPERFRLAMRDTSLVSAGIVLLAAASVGIVISAEFFANKLGVPVLLIGVLVTGLGNALPEIYFAIISDKHHEAPLVIGNLMGSVIVLATLVLGLVAIIHPITTDGFQFVVGSRLFLIAATILFYVFARSKNKISYWEGAVLLFVYLLFVVNVIAAV